MKKFLLALIISAFAINSYSATSFDTKTSILNIPMIEVNGTPTFSDVELKLRSDGLLEIVGGKEYTPPAGDNNGDYLISQIDGKFTGWDGETFFELTNGQVWKQAVYDYWYHYAFMPKVKITYNNGIYEMEVENVARKLQVIRIK